LKGLYAFARNIKAPMKWMEYLEDPIAIIMNSIWLAPSDAHIRVAQLLAD
jgi:fumarate reductase subunit C